MGRIPTLIVTQYTLKLSSKLPPCMGVRVEGFIFIAKNDMVFKSR